MIIWRKSHIVNWNSQSGSQEEMLTGLRLSLEAFVDEFLISRVLEFYNVMHSSVSMYNPLLGLPMRFSNTTISILQTPARLSWLAISDDRTFGCYVLVVYWASELMIMLWFIFLSFFLQSLVLPPNIAAFLLFFSQPLNF